MPPAGKRRGSTQSDDDERRRRPTGRQIFQTDGRPVVFYFHASIRRKDQQQVLLNNITNHGGKVTETEEDADVTLVSAEHNIETMRVAYNASDDAHKRRISIEQLSFVQRCIKDRVYKHILPSRKGMSGYIGRQRGEYTNQDDDNLCKYIARRIWEKSNGGRTGNKLYQELITLANDYPEYEWARRHTWQSWRERYRKNTRRLDPVIRRIADEEGPTDKQRFPEDRRLNGGPKRRLRALTPQEEEEDTDQEDLQDIAKGEFGIIEISDDESEPPEQEKKRRRSSGHKIAPSPQRKRTRYVIDDSPKQDARSKGKQRAELEDEVEIEEPPYGIDDDDNRYDQGQEVPFEFEPHQSALRSPERTLVDPSRSRNEDAPFSTQRTLVNEEPFEPVSHSTSANRRHSGDTRRSPVAHLRAQAVVVPPPSFQRRQHQQVVVEIPRRSVDRSSSSARRLQPANAQIPPEPSQPVIKPRPKPSPKLVTITSSASLDPPYRNTRSRSREPEAIVRRSPKAKKAEKETIYEEPEAEQQQEDLPAAPEVEMPFTETVEEEMDVANLLTAADESNHSIQLGPAQRRAQSLETDDAQTRDALFHGAGIPDVPQVRVHPPPPTTGPSRRSTNRVSLTDALRLMESTEPKWGVAERSSLPTPQLMPLKSGKNNRQRYSEANVVDFKLPEPRTPSRTPGRVTSASSEDSFPLRGTRASTIKKRLDDVEKRSPYRPIEGTKAAMLSRKKK